MTHFSMISTARKPVDLFDCHIEKAKNLKHKQPKDNLR